MILEDFIGLGGGLLTVDSCGSWVSLRIVFGTALLRVFSFQAWSVCLGFHCDDADYDYDDEGKPGFEIQKAAASAVEFGGCVFLTLVMGLFFVGWFLLHKRVGIYFTIRMDGLI